MRRALAVVLLASACAAPEHAAVVKSPAPVAAAPVVAPARPVVLDETAKLVELSVHGPGAASFPQADAVVVLAQDDVTLGKDGRVIEKYHSIVRILEAQRGKQKFADVHVPYDSARQSLTIDTARTANADGVHAAAAEEISDIVPEVLREASVYSSVLERVVSFPGVDKGSVLELAYTRTTGSTPDAALGGEILLADWDPVVARVVTITVPDGVAPHLQVQGATLAPVETHDAAAGTHTFTFTLRDQPDRQWEMGSVAEAAILPRLVYSFLPDWDTASARVVDRYLKVVHPASPAAPVAEAAHRLVARARTDEERAAAILKFVAQDVRSVYLPLGWAGYAPNAPEQVLKNLYGDDRDKVGLFVALCAAAGLDARPAFVSWGGVQVADNVPTVAQFNRLIARVELGGSSVWVDPSDTYAQLGTGSVGVGTFALVLAPGKSVLEKRPLPAPESSVSRVSSRVTLDDRGALSVTYRYSFTGLFVVELERGLRVLKGELLDKHFQDAAMSLSSGALDVSHTVGDLTSVSGPVEVTHVVRVPGFAPPQGNFRVVELPAPTLGLADYAPSSGLSTRRLRMWLGAPRTRVQDTELALPAGWKVVAFPPPLDGDADGVHYKSSCTLEGRVLRCHEEVQTTTLTLTPEEYLRYRDAMVRLDDYKQRVVLLGR